MPFSFSSAPIFGWFNKITFLIFPDASGRVGKFFPCRGDAEKLAGSGGKKIKSIPPQERFLWPKQKKRNKKQFQFADSNFLSCNMQDSKFLWCNLQDNGFLLCNLQDNSFLYAVRKIAVSYCPIYKIAISNHAVCKVATSYRAICKTVTSYHVIFKIAVCSRAISKIAVHYRAIYKMKLFIVQLSRKWFAIVQFV